MVTKGSENLKTNTIKRDLEINEFRALAPTDNTGYIIDGYAVVYEQTTTICEMFNEVVKRGALDGADLTDVLLFVHHDQDKIPLARSRRNNPNSTLQLRVDDKGLYFSAELDVENNVEAKALYSSVKRGDISGMSFSFRVKEETWTNLDSPLPTREIHKFERIGEISALSTPAYLGSEIYARSGETLDNVDKLALDSARSQSLVDTNKNELELLKLKMKFRV